MPPPPAEDPEELPGRFSQLHSVVLICDVCSFVWKKHGGNARRAVPILFHPEHLCSPLACRARETGLCGQVGHPPVGDWTGSSQPLPGPVGSGPPAPARQAGDSSSLPALDEILGREAVIAVTGGEDSAWLRDVLTPALPGSLPAAQSWCLGLPATGGWGWGSGWVPCALLDFPLSCSLFWKSSAPCLPCQEECCFWPAVGSASPPAGQFTDCCLCRATHHDPNTQELGRVM